MTLKRGSKGFKDYECKEFQLKPKPSMGPADARTITGSLYITMRMKKETLDAKQMRVHCRKLEKSWHRQIFGAQSRARAFSDATMIAARGHALPGTRTSLVCVFTFQ